MPWPPLTLQVTGLLTLTMMVSGHVTLALDAPWTASYFSMAAAALVPGIWTDPGVNSYV
jgi:hypothetical protein